MNTIMVWKGASESEPLCDADPWRISDDIPSETTLLSLSLLTKLNIKVNYTIIKWIKRVAGLLVRQGRLQEPRGRRWLRERACSSTWRRVVPKSFRLRWMTASADVDGAWCGSGGAPTPRAWELNSSQAPPHGPEPTNQRPSAPPPPATTTAARLPSIHNHPGRRSHQLIRVGSRRIPGMERNLR